MSYEWMDKLKTGDYVFLKRRFEDIPELIVVSRTTKTRVILESGVAYSKSSNKVVGDDLWVSTHLIEYTTEKDKLYSEARLRKNIIGKIVSTSTRLWEKVSTEELTRIATVIYDKEKENADN